MNIAPTVSPQCRYGCLSLCMDLKSWEMGLFHLQVLKASALLVKEIKVHEHLLNVYESNVHVPCLRPFCAQSCGWEMVQWLGVHNVGPSCWVSSGVFLCVRVQVQNLGEPGPVVTSFAKHPGSESWRAWSSCDFICKASRLWSSIHFGWKISCDSQSTVPPGMYLSALASVWILCWTLLLFLYDGGQLKSLCIHLIFSRIWCGSSF
jgi:hypothetical protein